MPDTRRAPPPATRLAHRLRLFSDRDVLHGSLVAVTACVASLGLVYLAYLVHVWRVARGAGCEAGEGRRVLVFGKHAPGGRPDADFEARLDRAAALGQQRPGTGFILLGGGAAGEPSEAELARRGLLARGLPGEAPLWLEDQSRDTLQNLRNARDLLALIGTGPDRHRVTLLSSRYHLARCLWFARRLGYDAEPCAAEPALRMTPANLCRLAGEAGYIALVDLGTRWAKLIGSRRMLARTE
ncbi:YdcF family protein [Marilutibacter alkalisoli]|uniref:YdcF family protein n=1 Tax=Marilutibacter alkalisoli TaxID=2591633 RepID=A0A514BVG6_9GAMM|nr:YdcF family protein [Lysobacter alkalisoli]QDH71384.1 YdcF family protein [Lysobacter alkalisoli]